MVKYTVEITQHSQGGNTTEQITVNAATPHVALAMAFKQHREFTYAGRYNNSNVIAFVGVNTYIFKVLPTFPIRSVASWKQGQLHK